MNLFTYIHTFYSLHAGKFYMFFGCLLTFFQNQLSKQYFRNTIRVSNSFDPDQAHILPDLIWTDLSPNCLPSSSADGDGKEIKK